LRGLLRRFPDLDLVRVQDVGLMETHDTDVLAWSGRERRFVLTHDFATMIDFAYSRVANGLEMPGVIAVPQDLPVGEAIEELATLIKYSLKDEWKDQVVFLPLKN
jgi:Domain of unknown function (DUF5615)